jgi:Ca2+-binding RTX toxin-like protein
MSFIASNNLVTNGSFEDLDLATATARGEWWSSRSIAGWVLEGTQRDGTNWFEIVQSGHRGVVTEYGSKWLDMDASSGNIAIRQQVANVEAGKSYTLFVTLASSGKGDGVDIFWGGVKLANIVPAGLAMETYSVVVTGYADAALNTIRLAGTGSANGIGVSLDDVSLVRNPDPIEVDPSVPFVINAMHEGTVNADAYKYGAGSGREFFINFDERQDRIYINKNLATSWADLQSKAAIYQSEGSTVVEFKNGTEVFVLTQFDVSKLGPSAFVFEGATSISSKTVGGNLIQNGSFEKIGTSVSNGWGLGALALDGWSLAGTATQGSNWFEMHSSGVRNVAASDGKYWLDLDASSGNISVSQHVNGIDAGRFYTVTFSAASSKAGNAVDVSWDGQKLGTVIPTGTGMQEFSFVVEGHAGATLNNLTFSGTGSADGYGVSLDNVRMFAHETVVETADVFSFGLGSGRMYAANFDVGRDIIIIKSNLFENFEQFKTHTAIYQDGKSTIIEFDNGREVIVLPQFDAGKISAEMFKFEGASKVTDSRGRGDLHNGTEGNDTIICGAGNQTIDGGVGFDILTGGVGADKFMFNAKSGHDFITDFTAGEDRIVISRELADSFEALMKTSAVYQDGHSTQIEFAGGQLITLYGVEAARVSAEWFAFA